jgi:uncharacterized protein YfaS (alpha-2-macroglobulin family)
MRNIILTVLAALLAATLGAAPARADDATLFTFRHVILQPGGAAPAVCLRFSQNLDPGAAAHYEDYLKFVPAVTPAVTAAGTDLCLAGLDPAVSYQLTILQGLSAASGARLAAAQTLDVALADQPPLVAIGGDGFVLPRGVANGLDIQTVNVRRLKIHVLRMSDAMVPARLGGLALSAGTMARYQLRSLLRADAAIVWTGTMAVPADHNRTVETAFDLAGVIPPGRAGLYLVVAENAATALPESQFTGAGDGVADFNTSIAAHWVVATDIALTSVCGADGLHVFARSLASARPLAGVDVRLLSAGLDVLGEVATGPDGEADFAAPLLAGAQGNAPATLLAYGNGDFAFQNLAAPGFDLSDRGVSGRDAPPALQAFMYTERGVYRPGETMDVMALLRDRLGNAVDDMPLKFLLRRPDGVVDRSFVAPPAADGGFFQAVALSATAARGMWTLEAYADPTAAPVGRVQAQVQDFVPQELQVTLTAAQKFLNPEDSVTGALSGAFLYGAPAAGLHAQADLRVVADPAPLAGAAGYSFGLVDDKVDDTDQSVTLPDADGRGDVAVAAPLPPLPETSLPLKAILTAGIFEPGGRYVSDEVAVPIRARNLLIGIRPLFAGGAVGEGQTAAFDVQTFDRAGAPVPAKGLGWTLVREDQIFDWFRVNSGDWTWHYHTQDRQLASGALDVAPGGPAAFSPPGPGPQDAGQDWGTYRLIVTDRASGAASSVRFTVGWDSTASAGIPDKAVVLADTPLLAPGGRTQVHIKGPFAGPAEVVIANDRVFSRQTVDVPKAGATIAVTADAGWGAGAYVIVSMVRPLVPGGPPDALAAGGPRGPVRAIGVAWLGIDPGPHRLAVAIAAPAKIAPRQTVKIAVRISGATPGDTPFVTLAAVDEGILQLTHAAAPDPLGFFYGKLNLAVDIRDDYGNLLDGGADAGAIEAGGDAGGPGGPELPVTSSKVVSLFSGPVAVGADGVADIPITVPDFEGQLRLMAVAYDKTQTGAAQASLIVRDAVIADVALPRFLAPGDSARLAIFLHNTDGPAGVYDFKLLGGGAAGVLVNRAYVLAAGQRVQDTASLVANAVGTADITADLTGPAGYHVHRGWQVAVRAPHDPVTVQQIALQPKGGDFRPDAKLLARFMPGSLSVSLGYAAYQGIDVPGLLQSLSRYPYGCTEQLVSVSFPLLYYNDKSPQADAAGVKARVGQAVETLLDRQDSTGAFGLWRVADGQASAWLDVYAMDFLARAQAAGYPVPAESLARGYANLLDTARKIDSGEAGGSFTEQGMEAPQATLAYTEYVLARGGRADIGLLRRQLDAAVFISQPGGAAPRYAYWQPAQAGAAPDANTLAQPLALAQLGGALALMGDAARAATALQMAAANSAVTSYPGWWFDEAYYTPSRDLAGMIAIAAETGNPALADTLLGKLNALNLSIDELNTQDKAWLLAAADALDRGAAGVRLTVNGKPASFTLPAGFAPDAAQIAAGFDVRNTSTRDLWRSYTLTGAPVAALPALSQGYSLQKSYFTVDGTPVDPGHLRQNDRVVVALTGQVNDNADHRSVLVDLLPAGWEIEAPITDDSTDYGFLGPLSKTRVIEARDDRFVAAFDLGAGWPAAPDATDDGQAHLDPARFALAYLVRAVTPGVFAAPEAVVNDMYRPALMARTAAGQIVVDAR